MDETLKQILEFAISEAASDIHLSANEYGYIRVQGELQRLETAFSNDDTERFAQSVLAEPHQSKLERVGSVDGAFSLNPKARFRFNIYRRSGAINLVFRLLPDKIARLSELGFGDSVRDLTTLRDGLVLVAGPTGSGKSTTLAACIDQINETRSCHVISIEDPVEFLHPSKKALVNQREIGRDVASFHQALIDAVRQDPDVILVGELRDQETVRTAVSAAETGHLVYASVHAGDCKSAIERLISSYPAEEQGLAQRLVATVLRTVLVQHLLPRYQNPNLPPAESKLQRVMASEMLRMNSAAANSVATGTMQQLAVVMESSGEEGMWTLDFSLAKLLRQRLVSEQTAKSLARQPELLGQLAKRVLNNGRGLGGLR